MTKATSAPKATPKPAATAAPQAKPATDPPPGRVLTPAELEQIVKDPLWWQKIDPREIGVRAGRVLTDAQFQEMRRKKMIENPRILSQPMKMTVTTKPAKPT